MDFVIKLREMFPHCPHEQVQEVVNYVLDADGALDDETFQLERMTDLLLEAAPPVFNIIEDPIPDDLRLLDEAAGFTCFNGQAVPDIHARLIDMLPNVDPSYLWEQSKILLPLGEEALAGFVEDMIARKEFPTIEQYNRRQEIKEEQIKYTSEFKIDEFLDKFPEPEQIFEDPERVHSLVPKDPPVEGYEEEVAFARTFLCNHYNKLHRNVIEQYMVHYKNDILKVCAKLDQMPNNYRSNPSAIISDALIKNKLMLQELAYGTKKKIIKRVMQSKSDMHERLVNEARAENMLFECQNCGTEIIPQECYLCTDGCIFCYDCVKRGNEILISEGLLNFPCFSCSCEFRMATLRAVVDPKLFHGLEQRKYIAEIRKANVDGFETCPFCDYGTIPDEHDKTFKCENSKCMIESCRECRHKAHIPLRCCEIEYDEDVQRRTLIEEAMSRALMRTCKQCGRNIVKSHGCNNMPCICGAHLCYVCGACPVNYNHFGATTCPLHSDLDELHFRNIRDAALAAKKDIGADVNPNILKFDPAKNL